ncbi:hypothetical protein [Sediminicola luteus]|uniref:Uncharacterized protein n=1 Tax=Sediminicola luteus TaxID=319238 RepID=A0ABV2TTV0_9FLAO
MCKISDEIKLCACATNIESLNNMWVLKNYLDPPKIIFGEFYPSHFLQNEQEILNRQLFLAKLNSKNLFDFEYTPIDNDQLEISICVDEGSGEFLHFTFYFYEQKWSDRRPPYRQEQEKVKNGGYIKNAI